MLTWNQVAEKLSRNPHRILGLPEPKIKAGELANLTIIDPEADWVVDKTRFKSRSRNTPFHGWKLTGKVLGVVNKGFYMFYVLDLMDRYNNLFLLSSLLFTIHLLIH